MVWGLLSVGVFCGCCLVCYELGNAFMHGDSKYPIWSRKRFLIWAVLGLVSALLFSSSNPLLRNIGMLLSIAFIAKAPRYHFSTKKVYNKAASAIAVIVVVVIAVALYALPDRVGDMPASIFVMHHPALVWPVYIACVGMGYWRWVVARGNDLEALEC